MSSNDGSDSDVDIYGDLPHISNQEETLVKLDESKKQLEEKVETLKKQIEELLKRNRGLESKCKALGTNISSLYKTASAEIKRKDCMIEQLRKEKDNIIFRRNRHGSEKKNYITNENVQQVGVKENIGLDTPGNVQQVDVKENIGLDTPDASVNENSQYTYSRNENRALDNVCYSKPARKDDLTVQEYDTVFNRRQKQLAALKKKQEISDGFKVENKNSEYTECVKDVLHEEITDKKRDYESIKSVSRHDLVSVEKDSKVSEDAVLQKCKSNKMKSILPDLCNLNIPVSLEFRTSDDDVDKYSREETLSTNNCSKEIDADTSICNKDESETSKEFKPKHEKCEDNLKDTSLGKDDTVSLKNTPYSERWGSYRIPMRVCETNVSQGLKNVKSETQHTELSSHESFDKENTSDCTSSHYKNTMISNSYDKCVSEQKYDNGSKTVLQASEDKVISESINSPAFVEKANIFNFKLSEHCEFKRRGKCRIKRLSVASNENLKAFNSKSDSSFDKTEGTHYKRHITNENILSNSHFQRQVVVDITLKESCENTENNINEMLCSVNDRVVNNEKIDHGSDTNPNKIHEQKTCRLENRLEIEKKRNTDNETSVHKRRKSAGTSDKLSNLEISANTNKHREHVLYSKYEEEGTCRTIDEERGVTDHFIKGTNLSSAECKYPKASLSIKDTQMSVCEDRKSWGHSRSHQLENRHDTRCGFRQMTSNERNKRFSYGEDSSKSGHHNVRVDREKFKDDIFKGTNRSGLKHRNIFQESTPEMKKHHSKKLRLGEKMLSQYESNEGAEREKTLSRVKYKERINSLDNDITSYTCALRDHETETGMMGKNDFQKQRFCLRNDSVKNDRLLHPGSSYAHEIENQREPIKRRITFLKSSETIQMVNNFTENSDYKKSKRDNDNLQTKMVPTYHDNIINEQSIVEKNSLDKLKTNVSSKSRCVFGGKDKITSQISEQKNYSVRSEENPKFVNRVDREDLSNRSMKETETCGIHTEEVKESNTSPALRFSVKRKARTFRLEDSRVVSVNISPPERDKRESVNIVISKSDDEATEMCKNISQYKGINHSNNKHTSNDTSCKTDLHFRQKYADVFSQDSSEDEFVSSSSYESGQLSDESWHPGKKRNRKFKKTRRSSDTNINTKRLRTEI